MAYIRKQGQSWRAQITRKGFPTQTKSFKTNMAARTWARKIEYEMDTGSFVVTEEDRSHNLDYIIDQLIFSFERFGEIIAAPKLTQLNQMKKYFGSLSVHDLTVEDILEFAAMRRKTIKPSTLQQQIYYLSQAIRNSRIKMEEDVVAIAKEELTRKRKIAGSKTRRRRLYPGEYELLIDGAYQKFHQPWIIHAIDIAIESAMRQGEIHALKRQDIDFKRSTIQLLRKDAREEGGKRLCVIPLLAGVREAFLRAQNYFGTRDNLFHVKTSSAIGDTFAKLTKYVGIEDLRFHDLRHEALWRLIRIKKMRVEEAIIISGHSSIDQLLDYVNLSYEDLSDFI